MAISITQDFTQKFNANSGINLDVSGWDAVVLQLVSPSSAVNFKATNDGGGVQGESDGDAEHATNWYDVQGVDIKTGTAAITTSTSSIYRFSNLARYIQFKGTSVTATKVYVMFTKIS